MNSDKVYLQVIKRWNLGDNRIMILAYDLVTVGEYKQKNYYFYVKKKYYYKDIVIEYEEDKTSKGYLDNCQGVFVEVPRWRYESKMILFRKIGGCEIKKYLQIGCTIAKKYEKVDKTIYYPYNHESKVLASAI